MFLASHGAEEWCGLCYNAVVNAIKLKILTSYITFSFIPDQHIK